MNLLRRASIMTKVMIRLKRRFVELQALKLQGQGKCLFYDDVNVLSGAKKSSLIAQGHHDLGVGFSRNKLMEIYEVICVRAKIE